MVLTQCCSWLFGFAVLCSSLTAQVERDEVFHFDASDGMTGDEFGGSVDMDDDWFVVGAHAAGQGAVYVYERGLFRQETKLTAVDGASVAFGYDVALSGNFLAVGDPLFDSGRGRVHVYEAQGGIWVETIVILGEAIGDEFGFSLDVDAGSELLAIGARLRNGAAGTAYIFGYDGVSWSELRELFTLFGKPGDQFGYSIDLDGGVLAVGGPGAGPGSAQGEVYLYHGAGQGWWLDDTLPNPSPDDWDWFGKAVSVDGGVLAVGAPGDDDFHVGGGSVSVYQWDGAAWIQKQQLSTWDGASYGLGHSVQVEGTSIIAGAPNAAYLGDEQGSVYHWRHRSGLWLPQQKLMPSGWETNLRHGQSVAAEGDTILVGVSAQWGQAPDSGVVSVYELPSFSLDVDPGIAVLGDNVHLKHSGGAPNRPVALFVIAVQGAPYVSMLVLGGFNSQGAWTLSGPYLDPGLAGLEIDFLSFSLNEFSAVEASNVATLKLL